MICLMKNPTLTTKKKRRIKKGWYVNSKVHSLHIWNQSCGQITTFHATTKSRIDSSKVGRITERSIAEGQSFSWEGQQFIIPPLPPSYLAGCRIIDIRYILQVSESEKNGWALCMNRLPTDINTFEEMEKLFFFKEHSEWRDASEWSAGAR